ncbi:MAG TPA: FMN-binding negative transcriptional regulator [Terriglobales bacterium]|nr:FMN-binding negative transcriptional regulator [Terriglobales bacterium]
MFVRPCWKPRTDEENYDLIEQYPWAVLINNGDDGPYATNMPLLLDRSRGNHGVLVGHIARSNAHASVLQTSPHPTLVIFEGPSSYVTGSWYPNRDMPSTYYYTAVHCYGNVRLQADHELEHWLGVLTTRMEAEFPDGWKMTDIDHSGVTRRLHHIQGFEIPIRRIEGKFKLGQDEPRKDAMAVAAKLAMATDPAHRALAEMIRVYNQHRSEP